MAKILALDTSTDACSVALTIDGEYREDFRIIPRQHTKELLPMVSQILSDADLTVAQLDAIAFGRGPGSFAGIRIATGTAQGLAFAAELPVLPVSTLAAMALQVHRKHDVDAVCAALDARMDEIYTGAYLIENGLPVEQSAERVCRPADMVLATDQQWFAVGKGWNYIEDMPPAIKTQLSAVEIDYYPSALDMLKIAEADFAAGKTQQPEQALPVYLRDEVAWKKKDQQ